MMNGETSNAEQGGNQPMFTAKQFKRPKEHKDAEKAFSYVIIDESKSDVLSKKVIYAGQFSKITKDFRMEKHKRDRPKVMENAQMIIVKEHLGPNAEYESLFYEFIIHAQQDAFSLVEGVDPGNFHGEYKWMSMRAMEAAETAENEEITEVLKDLETALRNREQMDSSLGNELFQCEFCSKQFCQKNKLDRHREIHEKKTKTFKCPDCRAKYYRQDELTTHQKVVHQGQPKPKDEKKLKKHQCKETKLDGTKCTFYGGSFRRHLKRHGLNDDQINQKYHLEQKRPVLNSQKMRRMDHKGRYSDEEGFDAENLLEDEDTQDSGIFHEESAAKRPRIDNDGEGTSAGFW